MTMKGTLTTALVISAMAIGTSTAYAQTPGQHPRPHSINAREARQVQRIKNGKENGELTKAELDKLRADEAALRARERVFRESGQGLNSAEYRVLERELDRLSKEISRATHNGKEPK